MAFKLENIWFGTIMMTVVFTIFLGFYGQSLSNYNIVGDNSSLGAVSNSLKGLNEPTQDMKDKIQGGDITGTDAVNQMVQGGYTASRNNPFTVATIGLNATQTIITKSNLGLDAIFYWAFGLMLTTAIVWAIIYLIMRYRVF